MLRVGLTGGIGSGKTTVAEMLVESGAVLIDADAISRNVTATGGAAIVPIADALGSGFIGADGALDRGKMRAASFADAGIRARLEAIVHPLVAQESSRQEAAAVAAGAPCIVFDIPLLVESARWRQRVDKVVVVDCVPEVQVERVMARSGLARAEVQRIIASQATRATRLRAADIVVFNAGSDKARLCTTVRRLADGFGL